MKHNCQTALAHKQVLERKELPAAQPAQVAQHYVPRVDVFETSEELVLQCDLPGAQPESIDLKFENGELTLHGKVAPRKSQGRPLNREYGVGDFFRTFEVRTEVEPGNIQAEYKLGVLTIHLPKKEAIRPKKIAVRA